MPDVQVFLTRPCIECGLRTEVTLDADKHARWIAGEHVQNVWPEMPAPEREMLITGTHPGCWDLIFSDDHEK